MYSHRASPRQVTGRNYSGCQQAVDIAGAVDLHPLSLVGTSVGVAGVASGRVDGRRPVLRKSLYCIFKITLWNVKITYIIVIE